MMAIRHSENEYMFAIVSAFTCVRGLWVFTVHCSPINLGLDMWGIKKTCFHILRNHTFKMPTHHTAHIHTQTQTHTFYLNSNFVLHLILGKWRTTNWATWFLIFFFPFNTKNTFIIRFKYSSSSWSSSSSIRSTNYASIQNRIEYEAYDFILGIIICILLWHLRPKYKINTFFLYFVFLFLKVCHIETECQQLPTAYKTLRL